MNEENMTNNKKENVEFPRAWGLTLFVLSSMALVIFFTIERSGGVLVAVGLCTYFGWKLWVKKSYKFFSLSDFFKVKDQKVSKLHIFSWFVITAFLFLGFIGAMSDSISSAYKNIPVNDVNKSSLSESAERKESLNREAAEVLHKFVYDAAKEPDN